MCCVRPCLGPNASDNPVSQPRQSRGVRGLHGHWEREATKPPLNVGGRRDTKQNQPRARGSPQDEEHQQKTHTLGRARLQAVCATQRSRPLAYGKTYRRAVARGACADTTEQMHFLAATGMGPWLACRPGAPPAAAENAPAHNAHTTMSGSRSGAMQWRRS